MPFAIIIRGPAGAGKSEISRLLIDKIPSLVCLEIDVFKYMISEQPSPIRSAIAHEVGSFFLRQLIKNGFSMVLDEIFREDYYIQVTRELEEAGYKIIKVFVTAPKEVLVERDKARDKNIGEEMICRLSYEIISLDEDVVIDTSKKSAQQAAHEVTEKLRVSGII